MCKYHEVAKVVEPKIATLRAAEAEFKVCRGGLLGRLSNVASRSINPRARQQLERGGSLGVLQRQRWLNQKPW